MLVTSSRAPRLGPWPGTDAGRGLLRIAFPAISGFIGLMLFQLVNVFWVSTLGTDVVAGVAAAEYWLWTIEAVMEMTTIGCATLIAQAIGAGDPDGARTAAREGILLSLVFSVGLTLLSYLAVPALLRWMGLDEGAQAAGWEYSRLLILGTPLLYLLLVATQIFNAHGDTKTVMLIMTAALVVNAVLDPLLIFGWGIFPRLGVAGAAWATVCGWTFGLLLRFIFLRRRGFIPPWSEFLQWSAGCFGRILRIGAPTAAAHLVWTSVYPLLASLITIFGMAPLAGMTIAHRFESLAYFTCLGFSIATATVVGQCVGRKDYAGAREAAYEARRLVTAILVPMSIIFLAVPEWLIALMTGDPGAIRHGADYLRTVGLFEVFLGWELVFEGGFNGLGSTRPYMFISIPLTLGRYPAAYIAVVLLGLPAQAIWWCISVSTLLKGVIMSWKFRDTAASLQTE